MTGLLRLMATLAVLPMAVAAQRSWVVDANNGPGTDFLDLPPAIAAVAAGDTLLVRPGTYSNSTIAKTLNVITDRTTADRPVLWELRIDSVAGAVVVKGLQVDAMLTVIDCTGRVHLQNLVGPVFSFGSPSVQVSRCRMVTIDGSTFRTDFSCKDSSLLLSNSSITQPAGSYDPALTMTRSTVRLVLTGVHGPDAICGFGSVEPGMGIAQGSGRLVLAAGSSVTAGQIGSCSGFSQPPAIRSLNGEIVRDPRVFLFPDRIDGNSTVTVKVVPAVVGWVSRETVAYDVGANPGDLWVLLASESTLDLPTPFGPLWVGIGHVVVDAGVLDASAHARGTVSFPLVRRGFPLTLQAVTLAQGPLALTEPSITVLR